MKNLTQQIYNIITNESFENLEKKLSETVERNMWNISERNEYSISELLFELPQSVDIIKQSIEDELFDTLPYNIRNQFLQPLQNIQIHINQIYTNSNQFPALMEQFQTVKVYIRNYRLDFETKRIPMYREKIKEYKELSEELKTILVEIREIKEIKVSVDNEYESISSVSNSINDLLEKIKKNDTTSETKTNEIIELLESSKETLSLIEQNKVLSTDKLEEIKSMNVKVTDIESDIEDFHSRLDTYIKQMDTTSKTIKENVNDYTKRTEAIISTNEEQTKEITKQLEKALGISLFSSFDKRKEKLNENLYIWLIVLGISTLILVGLSIWIYIDISDIDKFNGYYFSFKLAITIPLIYAIGFLSNRYAKERRLIEEYAFKSTISLSLKPFSDLVAKKIDLGDVDDKYRDFMIDSIKTIFNDPNDRVFGTIDKSDSVPTKILDKALDKIK